MWKRLFPVRQNRWFVKPLSREEGQQALRMARQALLNNTNGFLARQRLRLRLFFMGQVRPMKMDDLMALISLGFVGQGVFILVGTTTFASILLFLANTLSFQEYLGTRVCKIINNLTGYTISFKNAIVPRWRDTSIRLENVSIKCNKETWTELCLDQAAEKGQALNLEEIDTNFSYVDLTVDSIDVTLSLWRWLDGRGIITSANFEGIRGVLDRRHITWEEDWEPVRRVPRFGDFELDSLNINDALVTVLNPGFRPFNFSIFQAKIGAFRQNWMLYDFLCAKSIVGTFDDCLFSVHKPQIRDLSVQKELENSWSRLSNLKVFGLPIDLFNHGITGPLAWTSKGNVDLDLHFFVPHSTYDEGLWDKILDEVDGLREIARRKLDLVIPRSSENDEPSRFIALKEIRQYGLKHALNRRKKEVLSPTDAIATNPEDMEVGNLDETDKESILILTKVKLKNLKAAVPRSAPELSYMSNALIRPIVGYINANRTNIPLNLSARMDIANFNGALDLYSAGLFDIMAEETGRALSDLVSTEQKRHLASFGLWSVAEISQFFIDFLEHARGDHGFSTYSGDADVA